jgi:hypothetical protein
MYNPMRMQQISEDAIRLAVHAYEQTPIKSHHWHVKPFVHELGWFDDAMIDATLQELLKAGIIQPSAEGLARVRFTDEAIPTVLKWKHEQDQKQRRRVTRREWKMMFASAFFGAVFAMITAWLVWKLGWNK